MNKIYKIYNSLFEHYGPQGWWPFLNYDGENSTKTGNTQGYHKSNYSFPREESELFEVCLGSILTQNTTFVSVVKSLENLNKIDSINIKAIKNMDINKLKEYIKPSGYYNQKANYILNFIEFYESLNGRTPSREELLKVKGIGEETADSILLYGYNQCEFKVDAYTKRILLKLKLIDEKAKYKDMKKLMEDSLIKVTNNKEELRIIYQEYHALIVEHSKQFYSKKPYGIGCFLKEI